MEKGKIKVYVASGSQWLEKEILSGQRLDKLVAVGIITLLGKRRGRIAGRDYVPKNNDYLTFIPDQ